MTRHFLALFALFTGLAALQAPANASIAELIGSDAPMAAGTSNADAGDKCLCDEQARERKSICPKGEKRHFPARLPDPLRPPVLMGTDRALE